MNGLQIICGDAVEKLKELPEASVQCCVTSPPYFGLRDYGVAGQIGLEETPEKYVAKLVETFREVRRVLKANGTLWLNLGDSYAGGGNGGGGSFANDGPRMTRMIGTDKNVAARKGNRGIIGDLKPKDLIGIPWRVAFSLQGFAVVPFRSFSIWANELKSAREANDWKAVEIIEGKLRAMDMLAALQSAGWYLRSDIIWAKANCMPESVTDRPTRSHEYLFLLTKSAKYHYDHEAIKEPCIYDVDGTGTAARKARQNVNDKSMPTAERNGMRPAGYKNSVNFDGKNKGNEKQRGHSRRHDGFHNRWDAMEKTEQFTGMRNKRDVWTIATANYPESHFATFPPKLITPCIMAGSRVDDTVLDPFSGSGTTGQVALELGWRAILIELNLKYIPLIEARTNITPGLALATENTEHAENTENK